MSLVKYTNNAISTMTTNMTIGDTNVIVQPGHGAKFPSLSAAEKAQGKWFPVTLIKADGSALEIVKCTLRTGDTMEITRAQETTGPQAFSTGDIVSHRETAAMINEYLKSHNEDGFIWKGLNLFANTGTSSAMEVTVPNVTGLLNGMVLNVMSGDSTGAVTIDVNSIGAIPIIKPDGSAIQANEIRDTVAARLRFNGSAGSFVLENPQSLYDGSPREFDLDKNKRNLGTGLDGIFDLTTAGGDAITSNLTAGIHYEWTVGTRTLRLIQGFEYNFATFRLSGVTLLFDMPDSKPGMAIMIRCTGDFILTGTSTVTVPKNSDSAIVAACFGGIPRTNLVRPARGPSGATNEGPVYRANGPYFGNNALWNLRMFSRASREPIQPWQLNGLVAPSLHHTDLPRGTIVDYPVSSTQGALSSVGMMVVADVIQIINNSIVDLSGVDGYAGSSTQVTVNSDGGYGGNGGSFLGCYATSWTFDTGASFNTAGGFGGNQDADGLSDSDNAIYGPGGGAGSAWSVSIS